MFKTVLLLCSLLHPWLQCLPTSPLPWHLSHSTVSWFRDSVPQKLFLILWGYCSHGLAARVGSQWGQSTVTGSRKTVGEDGKGEQEYTSHEPSLVWLCIVNPQPRKLWICLDGEVTSLSIPLCCEVCLIQSFERWFWKKDGSFPVFSAQAFIS